MRFQVLNVEPWQKVNERDTLEDALILAGVLNAHEVKNGRVGDRYIVRDTVENVDWDVAIRHTYRVEWKETPR